MTILDLAHTRRNDCKAEFRRLPCLWRTLGIDMATRRNGPRATILPARTTEHVEKWFDYAEAANCYATSPDGDNDNPGPVAQTSSGRCRLRSRSGRQCKIRCRRDAECGAARFRNGSHSIRAKRKNPRRPRGSSKRCGIFRFPSILKNGRYRI